MLRIHTLRIAAPVGDVWRALTEPPIVQQWATVTPRFLPDRYPEPGDYALWWDGTTILHDEILRVEQNRRLTSRLKLGSALVLEEYLLRPAGPRATLLRSTWRGHPALADTDGDAMRRLAALVERGLDRVH